MGLGNDDDALVDDGDAGNCGDGCRSKSFGSVSCSICLDAISDNGDRSWAKLQCGHQFHLDCIGSAFNIKGAMQCPNCRKIEKGQWLYANGHRSFPEVSIEERMNDEDLYDLSYSEMSFGVHWCPFGSLARLPASFEEPEFPNAAYHDLLGQHAIFSDHPAVSSAAHPCPYVAYFGPIHPSSSNSSASVSEASNFNTPWNAPSAPTEMPPSFAFPAIDLPYHNWEHYPSPFATGGRAGGDQPSALPVGQRSAAAARASLEMSRSGTLMHPFLVNHGSGVRAGSSVTSTMIPPYPGSNARARDRVQALEAYYQQPGPTTMRTPPMTASRRSSSHRPPPPSSSADQSAGFYFFPSASSGNSGNFQEAENPVPGRFHQAWDRDYMAFFRSNYPGERESGGWGESHHGSGASDTSVRSGNLRQRSGLERTSSAHYRS